MDNTPLSVLIENGKGKIIGSFNEAAKELGLPAYLLEGIILEILSEVRNRKNFELILDLNNMKKQSEEEESN